MNTKFIIELIGYLGSIIVLVSFLMSSVAKLRVVNACGSFIFAVYALIIHSYPTALMNFCLVGINIVNLVRLNKTKTNYDLISGNSEEAFFRYILHYYADDIKKCFPSIRLEDYEADTAYIVCAGAEPAGIFLGNKKSGEELEIVLDYAMPAHREYSVGQYLYSELQKEGVHKLVYSQKPDKHEPYLVKMGFQQENGVYVKKL